MFSGTRCCDIVTRAAGLQSHSHTAHNGVAVAIVRDTHSGRAPLPSPVSAHGCRRMPSPPTKRPIPCLQGGHCGRTGKPRRLRRRGVNCRHSVDVMFMPAMVAALVATAAAAAKAAAAATAGMAPKVATAQTCLWTPLQKRRQLGRQRACGLLHPGGSAGGS